MWGGKGKGSWDDQGQSFNDRTKEHVASRSDAHSTLVSGSDLEVELLSSILMTQTADSEPCDLQIFGFPEGCMGWK